MTAATIDRFDGPHRFLSNFGPGEVALSGLECPALGATEMIWFAHVEGAFQAAKATTRDWVERIAAVHGPGEAKRLGRRVPLRDDWPTMRLAVMSALVGRKFRYDHELAGDLARTAPAGLVEGNTWGDQFWGVADGAGENHLGRILTEVRDCVTDRVGRVVAVTGRRPHKLLAGTEPWVRAEINRVLDRLDPVEAVSGMAVGADTWFAEAARARSTPLAAYVPFPGQAATWPAAAKNMWMDLVASAAEVVTCGESYSPAAFARRNELLVRRCSTLLAVWEGRPSGGTRNAIRSARRRQIDIVRIDPVTRRTTIERPSPTGERS